MLNFFYFSNNFNLGKVNRNRPVMSK